MNIQLLEKQSKFNRDCNTILDIIAPIICDRKITKREIVKANNAILEKFGVFQNYKQEDGKSVNIPYYSISKFKDYSTKIIIYCYDRYIYNTSETVVYIPEHTRTIYSNQETISKDRLMKYKLGNEYTPTKKQIEKTYKQYQELENKIKVLEDKKRSLPFHYYFNK